MKSTNKINIIVTSNKANPKELKTIIANGFKTYLIIMPGYGISQPRFTTIGSVAKKLWEDTSNPILAGLSVKSIKLLNNFVFKSKW